jgi:uncharacterized protein
MRFTIASVFTLLALKCLLLGAVAQAEDYTEVNWVELIPAEELEILMNPPEILYEIEDGSLADQLFSALDGAYSQDQEEDPYFAALNSANIVEKHVGRNIKLPGFVVPTSFNEQQQVTTFFLVPYFGACIHNPPPPPNQTLFIEAKTPFAFDDLMLPVWVYGTLESKVIEDELATSAYFMRLDKYDIYEL